MLFVIFTFLKVIGYTNLVLAVIQFITAMMCHEPSPDSVIVSDSAEYIETERDWHMLWFGIHSSSATFCFVAYIILTWVFVS